TFLQRRERIYVFDLRRFPGMRLEKGLVFLERESRGGKIRRCLLVLLSAPAMFDNGQQVFLEMIEECFNRFRLVLPWVEEDGKFQPSADHHGNDIQIMVTSQPGADGLTGVLIGELEETVNSPFIKLP